jgi:predicted ATPase
MSQNDVAEALESLVDKSMVEAGVDTYETSYRLLDTTRTYALEKLLHREEHDAIAARHANLLSKRLEERGTSTCLKSNRLHRAQELLTLRSAILA